MTETKTKTNTDAESAAATAAPLATGYVLSRRDRTAVRLIDWAVNVGTPEFQALYRPVSDELFTHHFVDPTAKPAFVPPALVSVEQLDAESDPLEVIRSHLGLVIDDRQTRDKARLDAQTHYEQAAHALADSEARAAQLQLELTDTTERLRVADAEIAALNQRLEAEVSGLHTSYTAQIDDLRSQLETDTASQRALHEAEIVRLQTEYAATTAALVAGHDSTLGGLTTTHESAFADAEERHAAELAEEQQRNATAQDALQIAHDDRLSALGLELAAALAAAEVTTHELREARLESSSLTAQRDRAIADKSQSRSEVEQQLAEYEESQLELTTQLELAQATIDEVEDVATAQLVDESETSDYAIGANDAAVLVLNTLYGEDAALDVDGAEPATEGDGPAIEGDVPDGAQGDSIDQAELDAASAGASSPDNSSADTETAGDSEFESALEGEVDIDFEQLGADTQAHRA